MDHHKDIMKWICSGCRDDVCQFCAGFEDEDCEKCTEMVRCFTCSNIQCIDCVEKEWIVCSLCKRFLCQDCTYSRYRPSFPYHCDHCMNASFQ